MSSSNSLQLVNERGWRNGFTNLLRKENNRWWGTRTWWVQSLIWLLLLNGSIAFLLWGPSLGPKAHSQSVLGYSEGLLFFMSVKGVFVAIGVIILMQGVIINEKQLGTAAWILSKPVSRSAFILSKLAANAIGILVTAVVLQDLVAYLQISLHGGALVSPLPYLAATSLQILNLLFYLTLTLMLGVFFNKRGLVSGISIVILFGLPLLWNFAPGIFWLLPPALPELALRLVQERPLPSVWPVTIVATTLWAVIFTAVAIWRFTRQEF
jgi:ABC-2 type transport system permease protein